MGQELFFDLRMCTRSAQEHNNCVSMTYVVLGLLVGVIKETPLRVEVWDGGRARLCS